MKKTLIMIFIVVALVGCDKQSIHSKGDKISYTMKNPTTTMVTVSPTPSPTLSKVPDYNINLDKNVQEYLYIKCKDNDWDYDLILSLLKLESNLDPNHKNYNDDGTVDKGLAQSNSSNYEWHKKLTKREDFNPYNPYHSIDACIAELNVDRRYWKSKGVTDKETLIRYCLNSYNMGIGGFSKYVRKTGHTSRGYDRNIEENSIKLKNKRGFDN